MARVRRVGRAGSADRGQLVLITALGLAVTFVVLTLLVNTAIQTGTLATRDDGVQDGWDALRSEADARSALERLFATTNERNDTSYADLEGAFDGTVDRWGTLSARHAAADGRWSSVSVVGTTRGTHIQQSNATRSLTDVHNDETWTLASGVSRIRAYRLNLTHAALVDPAPADPNASQLVAAGAFTVEIDDAEGRWRLFVYRDAGDAVVRVEETDGTLRAPCSVAAGPDGRLVVDLAAGTMDGASCSALDVLGAVAVPVDVTYNRSASAEGSYALVVDEPVSAVDDGQYGPRDGEAAPFVTPALYDATVELAYETADVRRRTQLRLAPGEPDG